MTLSELLRQIYSMFACMYVCVMRHAGAIWRVVGECPDVGLPMGGQDACQGVQESQAWDKNSG